MPFPQIIPPSQINLEYSFKGLMLKLKLRYFGYPDEKSRLTGKDPSWERLRAGGEGDSRGRDGWTASLIQRT